MSITQVANGLAALVREGKFSEATDRYYSDDIVSIEAMGGEDRIARGRVAIDAKGEYWEANHEVHGIEVSGPFVNGDEFALFMRIDMTYKPTNNRSPLEEVAVYTVKDDKIVHERFFYGDGTQG